MDITKLSKMSLDELRTLNEMINHVIQLKSAKGVSEIKVNDIVKINHPKVLGKKFYVVKINRKKMKVKEVDGGTSTYTVSFSLIEKI